MFVVAILIGIVAAGISDALTIGARRRGANGATLLAALLGIGVAIGGWLLVKAIDEELDVFYFVGFLPAFFASDFLSRKVSEALSKKGIRR